MRNTNVQQFLQRFYDGIVKDSNDDFAAATTEPDDSMKLWHKSRASAYSLTAESLPSQAKTDLDVDIETTVTEYRKEAQKTYAEIQKKLNLSTDKIKEAV